MQQRDKELLEEARRTYDQRLHNLQRDLRLGHVDQNEFSEIKRQLDSSIKPQKPKPIWASFKKWLSDRPFSKSVFGSQAVAIQMPPGYRIGRLLMFLLPAKDVDRILLQAIADMREEHSQALSNDRPIHAKYIVVRDHVRIVVTVLRYYLPGWD